MLWHSADLKTQIWFDERGLGFRELLKMGMGSVIYKATLFYS